MQNNARIVQKLTSSVILFPGKSRQHYSEGDEQMLVKCEECNSKAIIHSRSELDVKFCTLYCSCKNPHCGHTFAMNLVFSHTISPSAKMAKNNVIELLKKFPKEQLDLIKAAI